MPRRRQQQQQGSSQQQQMDCNRWRCTVSGWGTTTATALLDLEPLICCSEPQVGSLPKRVCSVVCALAACRTQHQMVLFVAVGSAHTVGWTECCQGAQLSNGFSMPDSPWHVIYGRTHVPSAAGAHRQQLYYPCSHWVNPNLGLAYGLPNRAGLWGLPGHHVASEG
jgi:hypothetical protein